MCPLHPLSGPVQERQDSDTSLGQLEKRSQCHVSILRQAIRPPHPTDRCCSPKIDSTTLDTYEMVVAAFSVEDKANQVRFFEKSFLTANVSPEVVFGKSFLTLSSVDVDFSGQELWWRTYTTKEALPTTSCVELVGKKEFAAAALDPEYKTYIVHVASLSSIPLASLGSTPLNVHPFQSSWISSLIVKKASTKVPAKYSDFVDVFSPDLTSELLEHSGINDPAIELVEGCQQPPYGPINSLEPVELKTLKAYIETNLANGFVRPSKSPAGASILFDRKLDGFIQLCIDY